MRNRLGAAGALLAGVFLLSGCAVSEFPGLVALTPVPGGQPAPQTPQIPIGSCPWVVATPTPSAPTVATSDPVAATEAISLDEGRFWQVIESIPDLPREADFLSVSSSLAGCSFDDIVAFDARLTLALYALDSRQAAEWYEAHDPSGLGFLADDDFLYVRCAAVLAGHDTLATDASEHILDWKPDSADLSGASEYLLYVGLDAAGAQGVPAHEYYDRLLERIQISYETGSNSQLWD